jgi:hypothetical protein
MSGQFVGGFAADCVEGDTIKFIRKIMDFDMNFGVETVLGEVTYLDRNYTARGSDITFRIKISDFETVMFTRHDQDTLEILFPLVDEFQAATNNQYDLRFATSKRMYRRWVALTAKERNVKCFEAFMIALADGPSYASLPAHEDRLNAARAYVTKALLDGEYTISDQHGTHMHANDGCEVCLNVKNSGGNE